MVSHIHSVRELIESVWIAADVPKIRDEMIDRLVRAIADSNDLAKEASGKAEKGQGGVPTRAHWYHLMEYSVQVLDSVCRNVEFSELNERMIRVEKEVRNIAVFIFADVEEVDFVGVYGETRAPNSPEPLSRRCSITGSPLGFLRIFHGSLAPLSYPSRI